SRSASAAQAAPGLARRRPSQPRHAPRRTSDMCSDDLENVTTTPCGPLSSKRAFGTVSVPLTAPLIASLLTVADAQVSCEHPAFSPSRPRPVPAMPLSWLDTRADESRTRLVRP